MTQEEAIDKLEYLVEIGDFPRCEDALKMAIKALKQMDVLDKIRAEIEEVYKAEETIDHNWAMGLKHSLKIIDKYRKVEGNE